MWKRDEAVRPASGQPTAAPQSPAPTPAGPPAPRPAETSQLMEKDIVNIGKSVVIKGELNGSEDLTIEGHVEGTIQLRDHVLTIGPNGRIKAPGFPKAVNLPRRGARNPPPAAQSALHPNPPPPPRTTPPPRAPRARDP